jgi:hypothetical protein
MYYLLNSSQNFILLGEMNVVRDLMSIITFIFHFSLKVSRERDFISLLESTCTMFLVILAIGFQ